MDSESEKKRQKKHREIVEDREKTVWVTRSALKENNIADLKKSEVIHDGVGGAICVHESGILLTTVISTCPFYMRNSNVFTQPEDYEVRAENSVGQSFKLRLVWKFFEYGLLVYKVIGNKNNNFHYIDLRKSANLESMSCGGKIYIYSHELGLIYSLVIGETSFNLPVFDHAQLNEIRTINKMSNEELMKLQLSDDSLQPYRLLAGVVDIPDVIYPDSDSDIVKSCVPRECSIMYPQLPLLQLDKLGLQDGTYMGQSGCPIFSYEDHELLGLIFFSKGSFRFGLPIGIIQYCWTKYVNESTETMRRSKDGRESSSKGAKREVEEATEKQVPPKKQKQNEAGSKHAIATPVLRTVAVKSASGSAYAEFGNTKVIVSVFGPKESKKATIYSDTGRLNCNVSYTTFATPTRGQGSDCKEISAMLHKALEGAIILDTFPKTTVDVFALVLESGGSDLPVVINCASLALADAGIMLYDLIASVSVSCLGKSLVIDPILEEESY